MNQCVKKYVKCYCAPHTTVCCTLSMLKYFVLIVYENKRTKKKKCKIFSYKTRLFLIYNCRSKRTSRPIKITYQYNSQFNELKNLDIFL